MPLIIAFLEGDVVAGDVQPAEVGAHAAVGVFVDQCARFGVARGGASVEAFEGADVKVFSVGVHDALGIVLGEASLISDDVVACALAGVFVDAAVGLDAPQVFVVRDIIDPVGVELPVLELGFDEGHGSGTVGFTAADAVHRAVVDRTAVVIEFAAARYAQEGLRPRGSIVAVKAVFIMVLAREAEVEKPAVAAGQVGALAQRVLAVKDLHVVAAHIQLPELEVIQVIDVLAVRREIVVVIAVVGAVHHRENRGRRLRGLTLLRLALLLALLRLGRLPRFARLGLAALAGTRASARGGGKDQYRCQKDR